MIDQSYAISTPYLVHLVTVWKLHCNKCSIHQSELSGHCHNIVTALMMTMMTLTMVGRWSSWWQWWWGWWWLWGWQWFEGNREVTRSPAPLSLLPRTHYSWLLSQKVDDDNDEKHECLDSNVMLGMMMIIIIMIMMIMIIMIVVMLKIMKGEGGTWS